MEVSILLVTHTQFKLHWSLLIPIYGGFLRTRYHTVQRVILIPFGVVKDIWGAKKIHAEFEIKASKLAGQIYCDRHPQTVGTILSGCPRNVTTINPGLISPHVTKISPLFGFMLLRAGFHSDLGPATFGLDRQSFVP